MRNVPDSCVRKTTDSIIKFQELRSIIKFHNSQRSLYKKVKVDGGALHEGAKCDNMLCSADEHEERYIELKGSDIPHVIVQPSLNLENMMAIVTRMLYAQRLLRELRLPYKKQKSSFGKDGSQTFKLRKLRWMYNCKNMVCQQVST